MTQGMWIASIVGLFLFSLGISVFAGWIPTGLYVLALFGLLLLSAILLAIGINATGVEKWRYLFLSSLMFFGFSLFYILRIGPILAPVALLLMILSARKLASVRPS